MAGIGSSLGGFSLPPSLWWLLVFAPAWNYFWWTRWPTVASYILLQQHQPSTDCTTLEQQQQQQQQQCYPSSNNNKLHQLWLPSLVQSEDNNQTLNHRQRLEQLLFTSTTTSTVSDSPSAASSVDLLQPIEWIPSFFSGDKESKNDTIVASFWRHDEELGRGYLLVSQGNRIWRWERGGGPIAVGKTLCLDYAGCRHDHIEDCQQQNHQQNAMVGGITVDFLSSTSTLHAGDLIVAERGEQRIIRLESDTGARTPLALWPQQQQQSFDDPDHHHQLLMTPAGDLLLLEHNTIHRLNSNAMTIPSLESLKESRLAHSKEWIRNNLQETLGSWSVWFDGSGGVGHPVGMVLQSPTSLYVSATQTNNKHNKKPTNISPLAALLFQVSIANNNDEDDDEDIHTTAAATPTLILNLTQHYPVWTRAGPLAVTDSGLLFWVLNDVHLLVLDRLEVLGHVTFPDSITSVTLGGDTSVLYITTRQSVWKWSLPWRVAKPIDIPLDARPKRRRTRPTKTTTTNV